LLLIPLIVFSLSGTVFGWGSTGGDGERYTQLQETAVFLNNTATSGAGDIDDQTAYHGMAMILDLDGSGVSSGTTLGAYVEKPAQGSGDADSILVVGVVANASTAGFAAGFPVVIVTKGAAFAMIEDSSDAVTSGSAVGCGGIVGAGNVGGGTNLGIALEAGDGTDADEIVIWVAPAGSGD
ncbi:hypothetical protein LCGC14_2507580, partial [marine sediment metagenome]